MRPLLDCAFGRRSSAAFTPTSFLHASFLGKSFLRNHPAEQQQLPSCSTASPRRSSFRRVGGEESQDNKWKTTVAVEEKEFGREMQWPMRDLEPRGLR